MCLCWLGMWFSPLLQLHFVLQADKRGVFSGKILPKVALSIYHTWLTQSGSTCFLPSWHQSAWSVLLRPWGVFLLASCLKTQPPRWAGGHAQLPHWGVTAAPGNKALWLLHPPREYLSFSVCLSCFLMKQMIFCSWWLRNTSLLYAFLCDPQTIRQCIPLLLSVNLVLS